MSCHEQLWLSGLACKPCKAVSLVMRDSQVGHVGCREAVSLLEVSCSLHSAVSGSKTAVRKARTKQLPPEEY